MMPYAVITKDPEYDRVALVERRRWRIDLPSGGRKYVTSKREAIEWCAEMGLAWEEE